jgi:hypothetical protein
MQEAITPTPIAGGRLPKRRFFGQRDKRVEGLVVFMYPRQAVFG